MSATTAQIRANLGMFLHASVREHSNRYQVKVSADPQGTASQAVQARHQEAEVLEEFVKGNPASALLTVFERQAAMALVAYLRSSVPPAYLGGKIKVDAEAAIALDDAMAAAGLLLNEPAPWGPNTLEQRLLELGFPVAIQVEEDPADT